MSPSKTVAYVDFDGVLTTARYIATMGGPCLNPFVCADMAELLQRNDMAFVVSSTWRQDEDCLAKMAAAGLPLDRLHRDWRTAPVPYSEVDFETGARLEPPRPTRQAEIEDHARRHGIADYLVFDDDPSLGGEPGRRQIRPNPAKGLMPADFDRAQWILDSLRT